MARIYRVFILRGSLALTLATLAVACTERPSAPASQRLVDLAAEHPEIVERLHAALERWRASAEAARLPSDEEASEGHSAQELERLRALGYI